MSYKPFLLFLLAGLFLISCDNKKETNEQSEAPDAPTPPEAPVAAEATDTALDGNWELTYIMDGTKTLEEMFPEGLATITINTAEERVNGNAGCNVFTGSCSVEGSSFKVLEPLAVTRKMCMEMSGEDLFLQVLVKVDSYVLADEGKTLDLRSGEALAMKFARK